jgi:ribosomal-protein-alanine N-acetyltransferase
MFDLQKVNIRKFQNRHECDAAARLLMNTDPWKTFGRTYENCWDGVTNPQKESFGAFMGDEFLGVLVIDLNGPFKGYIQAVCIVDKVRGLGLGSIMVKFAENRIFTVSPNCFLCYSDFNEKAQSFYENLGYEIVGKLDDYMIPGHSEIIMRKTIGPIMPFNRQILQTSEKL